MSELKEPLTLEKKKQQELEELKEKYLAKEEINNLELEPDLDRNLVYLEAVFDKVDDLVIKEFSIADTKAVLVYIGGIVDKQLINESILKPLMITSQDEDITAEVTPTNVVDLIEDSLLNLGQVETRKKFDPVMEDLLAGNAILLLADNDLALSLNVAATETRSVADPNTETVVRGPKEGFVENFETNLSLLRRRIKTADLKFETMKLGRTSKTDVAVAYIQGIAGDDVVEEVKERLQRIDIDLINESGNIEQLIEDDPSSPFPQMNNTERPDGVATALNEGRVAIIIDGTPFVLLVPAVFVHFLQSTEDYYQRFLFPTAIRLLRLLSFTIALLGPSVYIAITTYHQEMIPTPLLISIAASRSGVPFPAVIEALLMEVSFEMLREAGLRLPQPVGQAVSIVGALVVGEAAVQAGLVSQAMVIVVALTGIASFIIPAYNMGIGIRLLRFPIMFLAGSWGMFGITFAGLGLLIHLASLRSFGVPYLSPITPTDWSGLKDAIFKAPEWFKNRRPAFLVKRDRWRIESDAKPGPEQGDDDD
ncbi:spore germination protein [Halanaerobaculum tunisiense]